jgi:methylisocitrate lyase
MFFSLMKVMHGKAETRPDFMRSDSTAGAKMESRLSNEYRVLPVAHGRWFLSGRNDERLRLIKSQECERTVALASEGAEMDNRRDFLKTIGAATVGASVSGAASGVPSTLRAQSATPSGGLSGVFRDRLKKREPFENVAVSDVLSARMVEALGFPSLYLGSTGSGQLHGLPDWGLLSLSEQVDYFGRIAQSVAIPSVADVDVNSRVLVFYRAVQAFDRAGIAALHFGDGIQHGPNVVGLLSVSAMVDRIRAARDASPNIVLSIRCQGPMIEGMDRTLMRAAAYAQAGAETIMFDPVPPYEQFPSLADTVRVPITTSVEYDATREQIRAWKITVVVQNRIQVIAQTAIYEALTEFKSTGRWSKAWRGGQLPQVIPAEVRDRIRSVPEFGAAAKRYQAG